MRRHGRWTHARKGGRLVGSYRIPAYGRRLAAFGLAIYCGLHSVSRGDTPSQPSTSTAASSAAAAAPGKASGPSWLPSWFGGSSAAAPAEKTFGQAMPAPKPAFAPYEPAVLADALRAEQEAWDRRMEVCRKLREHAGDNESLLMRIDEIERVATKLYQERVARLGVKSPRRGGPSGDASSPASSSRRTAEPSVGVIPSTSSPVPSMERPASAGPFQVVKP